jgi:hypothetical protein
MEYFPISHFKSEIGGTGICTEWDLLTSNNLLRHPIPIGIAPRTAELKE